MLNGMASGIAKGTTNIAPAKDNFFGKTALVTFKKPKIKFNEAHTNAIKNDYQQRLCLFVNKHRIFMFLGLRGLTDASKHKKMRINLI